MKRGEQVAIATAAGLLLTRRWLALRRRIDLRGRVVLLTGGSRGLGLELARRIAAQGAHLALLARDSRQLDLAAGELARYGVEVLPITADLTADGDPERAVEETVRAFGRLDVLINNAGVIQVGPLENLGLAEFEDAMSTHFRGPLRLILAALPHLEASGAGRLVNISSIGGRVAIPHLAPYCASKFALTGLSEALRGELAERGVAVTTVTPGLLRTGSYRHALFSGDRRRELDWFGVASSLPLLTMSSGRAAGKIVAACREGRPTLTLTPQARGLEIANRLLPAASATVTQWAAALLPDAVEEARSSSIPGHRFSSRWVPSGWTRFGRRAARKNKQLSAMTSLPAAESETADGQRQGSGSQLGGFS